MIASMQPFPSHQHPSGWNALLPPRRATASLAGTLTCDYAVVGAGYTGLAAARSWAQARPQDRVCVVDAAEIGEGSSGRNSGFLLDIALADDAEAGALPRMEAMNALTRDAMGQLRALVDAGNIRCGLERAGTYRAAATERGMRAVRAYQRFLEASGLEHEVLDREALGERLGTSYYRLGLYSPDCHLVQPAALIRGLADTLPDNVSLFEHSPVLQVQREADRWRLVTSAGEVRAQRVLLANNAWAGSLGFAGQQLTPVFTYAALTAPLPAERLGDDAQWGLLPAARLGTTLRKTDDGRLLVRSLYSYRREAPLRQVEEQLRASMTRRWPALAGVPFEHVWGGSTGVTYNGAWVFTVRDDGLAIAAGCNGGGVVKGTLFGTLAAREALGEAVPDVRTLFGAASRVPGEPLRGLGFKALTALWRYQAGAEA